MFAKEIPIFPAQSTHQRPRPRTRCPDASPQGAAVQCNAWSQASRPWRGSRSGRRTGMLEVGDTICIYIYISIYLSISMYAYVCVYIYISWSSRIWTWQKTSHKKGSIFDKKWWLILDCSSASLLTQPISKYIIEIAWYNFLSLSLASRLFPLVCPAQFLLNFRL